MEEIMKISRRTLLLATVILILVCRAQAQCSSQTSCQACIRASPDCSWCTDPAHDSNSPRCFVKGSTGGCSSPDYIEHPTGSIIYQSQETFEGLNQITPLQTNITLRPNEPQSFELKVQPSNNYPIDLYLLMDLSYSMRDDLLKLKTLGSQLSERITLISSNFKLGFGSFVDKKLGPFANLDPLRLEDPCFPGRCQPPYSYHHVVNLTEDNEVFQRRVDEQVISGNQDFPEGGFDGFLQAIVCRKLVGWREVSRKLLLYLTDAGFHFAGDGLLAGVIKPNDGQCHMDDLKPDSTGNVVYQEWNIQDYPSIGQIAEKLDEFDVIPIFAVVESIGPIYELLADELGDRAYFGTLAADSSNVVDLVEDLYNRISQRVVFAPENVPGLSIKVTPVPGECPGEVIDGVCTKVTIGQTATFQVTVTVTECTDELASGPRIVPVRVLGFGIFDVLIDPLCNCSCDAEENRIPQSPLCSGQGDLACGVCDCDRGFFGEMCQCNSTGQENGNLLDCPTGLGGKECSGRGICTCGICQCRLGLNGEERFSGTACECDNTLCESGGEICSGPSQGECDCDICRCQKEPITGISYSGTYCDCTPNNQTCRDPDNSTVDTCQTFHQQLYKFYLGASEDICNGKGLCECGRCECFEPYYGTYCEDCSGTELCKRASCDVDGLNGMCAECVVKLLEVFNENNVMVNVLFTEEFVETSIQNGTLPEGSTLDLEDMAIYLPVNNSKCNSSCFSAECHNLCFSAVCNDLCPPLVITNQTELVDYTIAGIVALRCQWVPLDCDYRYYVAVNRTTETTLPIHVEYPPVCPMTSRSRRRSNQLAIPPWAIALILIGLLLLLGLLAIILLKLLLMLLDWIEVRKFEQELSKSTYPKHTNPLFRSPQKEYKNPIYGK